MTDNKILGNNGERVAKEYLINNNYLFIEQNYRSSYCEIDLIFKRANKYIFIEVKTRLKNSENRLENPLSKWQTKNIQRASIDYCFKNNIRLENVQLDLISIIVNKETKKAKLEHFKNILS